MAGNGKEKDEICITIARNGVDRKYYVEYHSHVQHYVASALAGEMTGRLLT